MDAPEPFASLAALRDANRRLIEQLELYGDDDFPDFFLDEIERFRARGAATGVILSTVDERGEAQSFVNFWLTILFNGGRRPGSVLLAPFDSAAARARAEGAPPYKGLDAFQPEDKGAFFGRAAAVKAMLERLGTARLLAVTGLSGSGKSSVVRAGLVPQLAEGALPGSVDWTIVGPVVPGRDPLAVLGRVGPAPAQRLAHPHDLRARLEALTPPVLLIVDQFEEVFSLCPDEDERRLVLASLAEAARDTRGRYFVVLTMRSEYDSRVEIDSGFAALFAEGRIQIGALSARELRMAIEQPAIQIGVAFESGLAEELVQRVLGEPAGLPLLQFTLLELWKRQVDNRLTWGAYAELGGRPREILARRATEVYESFQTPHDQILTRRIFLALAEIGAGLEATSRRVARVELDRIGSRDSVDRVLGIWQENGLIRVSPAGPIGPASQVEVAHEALIRNWDLLVGWIEDHFAEKRRRRVLTEQARAWREGKDTLLGELSLAEAEALEDLDADERAYVAASRSEADRQNRAIRWRRRFAAAAVVGSLLLTALAFSGYVVADRQTREASLQRRDAERSGYEAREAAARAETAVRRIRQIEALSRAALLRSEAQSAAAVRHAQAQLARAVTARDRLLVEQRRIGTRTQAATGELAKLERAIREKNEALVTAQEQARVAESALTQAEATIARAESVVAQERPTIRIQDFAAGRIPPVWQRLTEAPIRTRILDQARSVGVVYMRAADGASQATAFMVGQRLAATLLPSSTNTATQGWTLRFGDDARGQGAAFEVRARAAEVGFPDLGVKLVLLDIVAPAGVTLPPPLPLSEVTGTGRAAIRRFRGPVEDLGLFAPETGATVYLIGFPTSGGGNAAAAGAADSAGGVKRVQPGFVLAAVSGAGTTRQIRHDITTAPGNMGSPLFDIASGRVVGIHWGGSARSIGKYAVALDAAVLNAPALAPLLPRLGVSAK